MINNELSKEQLQLESLKELEFYTVLDKVAGFCHTDLGKSLVLQSAISDSYRWLEQEHSLIDEAIRVITQEEPISFDGLTDIRTKLHKSKIQNATMNTGELLNVKDSIRIFRLLKSFFVQKREVYKNIYSIAQNLHDNRILEKHIEDAIDYSGEVKDTASKELARIRREIREHGGRLRQRLEKILKQNVEDDYAQDDFVSMREGRFVLPIKASNKRKISGIIHGISNTGSTVYIEPTEIIEMNNNLSILQNEELREVHRILTSLTQEVGDETERFLEAIEIAAHIEAVFGKAKYALEFGGVKPKIGANEELLLEKVYHPILVHKLGRKKVMPISLAFGKDKNGVLISGPNAGGKTVALKSVGLNLALALSGLFPLGFCSSKILNIFSSIGDHQSIENNLSTFSSQINQLKNILSNSDSNTLVLVDEICSGTDPGEGAALAAGIMDTFLEYNLFFIITTHQSSLKTYALNNSKIENASLEFDEKNLKPSYKFLAGVPGNSYAFHLAKSVGLPANVLQRANGYVGDKSNEIEESIKQLTKFRNEAQESKLELDRLKLDAERHKKEYEYKLAEIKEKRKEFVDKAKVEALDIVKNANKLIENTIREIKEEKRTVSDIRKDFEQEKTSIEAQVQEIEDALPKSEQKIKKDKLEVGDSVTMDDGASIGVILEIDTASKTAQVEFNGLKFKVKISKLVYSAPEKKTKKTAPTESNSNIKFDAASRIDIRGMRAEESIQLIDNFINEAILGNVPMLTIVHGKGTGALRVAIQNYLRYHHQSINFRDGELVEGGAGVTVVML